MVPALTWEEKAQLAMLNIRTKSKARNTTKDLWKHIGISDLQNFLWLQKNIREGIFWTLTLKDSLELLFYYFLFQK